uniref:Dehydrogenase/reductase (SDR family) member 13a, duplicate 3 n=1 Tax=Callorhinchus milii TaxID=7868 RepID=A0A4W3IZT5_CALMI
MVALIVAVAAAVSVYIFIYYNFLKGVKCKSDVSLNGRTVIVTGANTGIGKETALDMARRGARVVLACRSKDRAEAAVLDIRRVSDNNQVVFMHLDLASLKSVRAFAETFLKSEPQLHILINNAGVGLVGKTEDGFSMGVGVNHFGHFLLTNLLLERLKQCVPSRVVVLASETYRMVGLDFSKLSRTEPGHTNGFLDYAHSKLCNVLFARELSNRLEGTNVTCYSVHPGVVNTEVFRHLNRWLMLILVPVAALLFRDPEGGAQTSIHCAVQEGIERFSGRYFSDCRVREVVAHARDDAVARKLWEFSERMVGLSPRVSAVDLNPSSHRLLFSCPCSCLCPFQTSLMIIIISGVL